MSVDKFKTSNTVRGKITENAPLGVKGWFKCGGAAEVLFKPEDIEDLQEMMRLWDYGMMREQISHNLKIPLSQNLNIFGALSNTIIRDGGLPGLTIRLGREFADIEVLEDGLIKVGAMALDMNVARVAADAGIAGLEFLSGIPGTIGGAIRMNAGCYGAETKDVLIEVEALDAGGNLVTLTPDDMNMSYRHNDLPEEYIFISATLRGQAGRAPEDIHAHIADIKARREQSQPIREKTGGSTFANTHPQELEAAGLPPDMKVWQLIDKVGGRGLMVSGAQMSEKHCNFMINTGNATATDLENLGEEIRRRVHGEFDISLRWEIRRVGKKPDQTVTS